MKIGVIIFAVYAVAIVLLIARYERPSKKPPRITGRGGDFE